MRVISVEVPTVSISVKERLWMWANSACFICAAKPTAALAAKYWAVMEQVSPMIPSAISTRHIRPM